MIKIIADDKIPFLKGALEPFADIHYIPAKEINNAMLQDVDALIIRSRTLCNKELLENTTVRHIATATIGFDHIDKEYCRQNQIKWRNAPGCNSGSVMQYLASVLVRLSMKYDFNFTEKTIGIIGYGNVGSKVAKLAKEMGFTVLISDPPLQRAGVLPKSGSLNEIKEKADIITFHVPLNKKGPDKTCQMVNANFLKSLKPSAIIINTSRGEIIDSQALKQTLINKQIKGAVLDVWENEPDIDHELLHLVDYATPHIAGYSVDGKANGTAMSVQTISNYFNFGLKNWFPQNVPIPKNQELIVDKSASAKQEMLSKLILETYDIESDHQQLLLSPETFEKQRGNYPLRHEFANYQVNMKIDDPTLLESTKNIGFKIV